MENIKIGLITDDREYGKALGLALVDVYRNFTVTLFKSVPLHNELDKMDLVLADSADGLRIKGKTIQLVEKQSMINKDYDDNIYRLYKYSNVRNLAGELLFIYANLTGRKAVPMRNANARIVVFGAVEGGAGCTAAAISFAREMSRFHGKKVIYITLEEIESTMEYMEKNVTGKNISEYLYYLFNSDSDQHFPFLESFTATDKYGVSAFFPSPGRNLLNSLSKEEMQFFVGAVLDTGGFDMMVIDLSNNMGKPAMTCYEMANNICLVSKKSALTYKEERFLNYFIFLKGEKILDRMGKIVTYSDDESEVQENEVLRTVCTLPYDPESFSVCNEVREIRSDGAYGNKIRQLAEAVIKNTIC